MLINTAIDYSQDLNQLAKHGVLIGIVSMAALQMAKDFLFSRQGFQSVWLMRWLRQRAKLVDYGGSPEDRAQAAENELTSLAAGGETSAFYNLPVEQLCGQVIAAAQAAMDSPRFYLNLLWCLGGATKEENQRRQKILHSSSGFAEQGMNVKSDLDLILDPPVKELRRVQSRSATVDWSASPQSAEWSSDQDAIDQYKAARNRVSHRIQRSVDGLQIAMGVRWKLVMQGAALGLSLVIAVWIAPRLAAAARMPVGFEIAAGLIGGFLAPIFRDLLSIIEKFRK